MSNDIPVSTIKEQSLTNTPATGDATLVDDPVALVDSSTSLTGGPNTPIESIQSKATDVKLYTKIPRSS